MLPTVSQFLCFRLRTGVLIIGFIQIIYAVLGIIGASAILADPKYFPDDKKDLVVDQKAITIIYLVAFILNLIIGSLLVRGVTKERPHLMRPWMAVQIAEVCFVSFATLFYVVCFWIFVFKGNNVEGIVAMISSNVVQLAIAFYILICVNSYHKLLTDSSYQPILSSVETV